MIPQYDVSSLFAQQLAADREHLHRNPELSLQEKDTAAFIATRLTELQLEVIRINETAVVGVLRNGDGPTVAYRADTDGLPVEENTGLPFASKASALLDGTVVPVMHACGHDIHVAVALGVVDRMVQTKSLWGGTVVFLFQPAEEIAAGAEMMINAGLWALVPQPEAVFGMHVMPYEAGKIFVPVGTAMSMADSFRVTVHGKGAHGSQPEKSIDPILLGAAMVVRLQNIVSREVSPRDTAVVTVGSFHGGLKENIIPDSAEFTINVRSFQKEVRTKILAAISRVIIAEAAASGAPSPSVESISSFPECFNDPSTARSVIAAMAEELGHENVEEREAHMASEDFGVFADSLGVPGVYWFLGGNHPGEEEVTAPVNHSPLFAPPSHPTLVTGVRAAVSALTSQMKLLENENNAL